MSHFFSPIIRHTCGKVVKYKETGGYGWITIGDERWNDAFVSHRDIEPEIDSKKTLNVGVYVKFDLHENDKGYVAKNVYPITESEYKKMLGIFS
jgi:cold shock CspA family protein